MAEVNHHVLKKGFLVKKVRFVAVNIAYHSRCVIFHMHGFDLHVVGRCGVVGSTLAFGSTGLGLDPEHRYFSHHSASAFSKLRSLA